MGSYFFSIRVVDHSKDYSPESKVVLDVPTAWVFFGKDGRKTARLVGDMVRRLVKQWNDRYATDSAVSA